MTAEPAAGKSPGQGHDLVLVSVDLNDQVEVPQKTTPRAVLAAAGLDPETRQLVRVHGRTQTPYTDVDASIEVHKGEVFVTVSLGPTPVS
jgi:hypothetical protein